MIKTLGEFKRSVATSELVEAKTVVSTNMRNNVKIGDSCFFEGLTKRNGVVSSEGRNWEEVYRKLPEYLKKSDESKVDFVI